MRRRGGTGGGGARGRRKRKEGREGKEKGKGGEISPPQSFLKVGAYAQAYVKKILAKLIIRVISFELTEHVSPRYHNVSDGQTDGRSRCIARVLFSHTLLLKSYTVVRKWAWSGNVTIFVIFTCT